MNFKEKLNKCNRFFDNMVVLLWSSHNEMGSCNKDASRYLVPSGTENEVTYNSKPRNSLRVSDHWNWYASTKKCSNEHYIQCLSVNAPYARKREAEGKASKPITAIQVCLLGDDDKYHVVYGEKYDKKTKTWTWIESSPQILATEMSC